MSKPKHIFEPDEIGPIQVDPSWTTEELLSQEALFLFKDVAEPLKLNRDRMILQYKSCLKCSQDPWSSIGVRKLLAHWLIRMKIFGPNYSANKKVWMVPFQQLPKTWDANQLLRQTTGTFRLVDVCKILPITPAQIRSQVKKQTNSREKIGVWKDEVSGYLVSMNKFGPWFKWAWLQPEVDR